MLFSSPTNAKASADCICARRERSTGISAAVAGAFIAAFLGVAPPLAEAATSPARGALENHACAMVLGLNPTEADYDACARSLDRTLSATADAQAIADHRNACMQADLQPNTPAFATCVVKASEAPETEWSSLIGAR